MQTLPENQTCNTTYKECGKKRKKSKIIAYENAAAKETNMATPAPSITDKAVLQATLYDKLDLKSSVSTLNIASTSNTQTMKSRCHNCRWKVLLKSNNLLQTFGEHEDESRCTMCSKLHALRKSAESYARIKQCLPGDCVVKEMDPSTSGCAVKQEKRKHCDSDGSEGNLTKKPKTDGNDSVAQVSSKPTQQTCGQKRSMFEECVQPTTKKAKPVSCATNTVSKPRINENAPAFMHLPPRPKSHYVTSHCHTVTSLDGIVTSRDVILGYHTIGHKKGD